MPRIAEKDGAQPWRSYGNRSESLRSRLSALTSLYGCLTGMRFVVLVGFEVENLAFCENPGLRRTTVYWGGGSRFYPTIVDHRGIRAISEHEGPVKSTG